MLPLIRTLRSGGRLIGHRQFAFRPKPHYGRTSAIACSQLQSRGYADVAAQVESVKELEKPDPPEQRFNVLGVQQVSRCIHSQLFPEEPASIPPEIIELAKKHLSRHELLGKNTDTSPPIQFQLPPLQSKTKNLDEHFWRLGMDAAHPYLEFAKDFSTSDLPPPPIGKWIKRKGWTKYYSDGKSEQVNAPEEEMMVFDVEVLYKISPFAVMACAASSAAWYAWISPWLLGDKSDRHLIPLGDPAKPRIIVGHNIGYDRARIAEEYNMQQSKFSFLDTMSLHVASNGMCSRQRPSWLKHRKLQKLQGEYSPGTSKLLGLEESGEPWMDRSSINSLLEVSKFHCNIDIDKTVRDQFGVLDKEECEQKLEELLDYCANDVAITHQVYKKVLPSFLEVCPHPVSFAALRHLSSVMLPVNKSWKKYIDRAEEMYMKHSEGIRERLVELAENALRIKDKPEAIEEDSWLRQLDWSGQEIKMIKGKNKDDPPRPAHHQKKPGMPKWYKDLFPKPGSTELNLSVRTRVSPLLLRLSWDNKPLIWSDKFGWIFRVLLKDGGNYEGSPVVRCDMSVEMNTELKDDVEGVYFKLPHKDGPLARCTAPLAKSYLKYFEEGILTSEYPLAKEALEMNAACSYWMSARERIKGQMVVYEKDKDLGLKKEDIETEEGTEAKEGEEDIKTKEGAEAKEGEEDIETEEGAEAKEGEEEFGIILPQIIPMGTITRRAVERTWLTASNAKKNRVGSELKAMVKAPPGYVFVGSDVDSQELWIASLVGDAQFKLHGGNAIGFMTLEGTKSEGTDLHSKTAKILGISRNDAKVFNYGRIYGAGVKFASTLLRQFNPAISDVDALKTAENLYKETKGTKTVRTSVHDRAFWRGGTESFVFNKLEEFADQDEPRTPVLGAGITEALRREVLSRNGFMPSRINWAIQSSGVDYLHLLIISMDHLIRKFDLHARLAITVHDEIRYLVKEDHQYEIAMALQVANVWTRAMFSQQMGIQDLPQSCAYFSAVDIDKVIRKEVYMECKTPSHPTAIEPGKSIGITELLKEQSRLEKKKSFLELPSQPEANEVDFDRWDYTPRTPVMEQLQNTTNIWFLKAQTATDEELKSIIEDLKKQKKSDLISALDPNKNYANTSKWEPLSSVVEGPLVEAFRLCENEGTLRKAPNTVKLGTISEWRQTRYPKPVGTLKKVSNTAPATLHAPNI